MKPLPGISSTTVLACTANSVDADGFLLSYQLQYSDGSQFFTPAAVETFSTPGTYTATTEMMDQFGATTSTSTTFIVGSGTVTAAPSGRFERTHQQDQPKSLEPMEPP